jgi:hypothetical protein
MGFLYCIPACLSIFFLSLRLILVQNGIFTAEAAKGAEE